MLLDYLERDKSVWQALLAKEQPKDQSLSYNELKKKLPKRSLVNSFGIGGRERLLCTGRRAARLGI